MFYSILFSIYQHSFELTYKNFLLLNRNYKITNGQIKTYFVFLSVVLKFTNFCLDCYSLVFYFGDIVQLAKTVDLHSIARGSSPRISTNLWLLSSVVKHRTCNADSPVRVWQEPLSLIILLFLIINNRTKIYAS